MYIILVDLPINIYGWIRICAGKNTAQYTARKVVIIGLNPGRNNI